MKDAAQSSLLLALILSVLGLFQGAADAGYTNPPYPEITSLLPGDQLFEQQQDALSDFYQAYKRGITLPALSLYRYTVPPGGTLYRTAAGFGVPYETIATLNGITSPDTNLSGLTILVPDQTGVFIPWPPKEDREALGLTIRSDRMDSAKEITVVDAVTKKTFLFFGAENFHSIERAYFLGILFRMPVLSAVLTDSYGERINPITRTLSFHNGLDLAAPGGDPVFAAREGTVSKTGYDSVYGNYIQIDHEGGYQTLYGHLKKINVSLNQKVSSSMIIGEVGSTGMSTGNHLHFEIRLKGTPENPLNLLPEVQ